MSRVKPERSEGAAGDAGLTRLTGRLRWERASSPQFFRCRGHWPRCPQIVHASCVGGPLISGLSGRRSSGRAAVGDAAADVQADEALRLGAEGWQALTAHHTPVSIGGVNARARGAPA